MGNRNHSKKSKKSVKVVRKAVNIPKEEKMPVWKRVVLCIGVLVCMVVLVAIPCIYFTLKPGKAISLHNRIVKNEYFMTNVAGDYVKAPCTYDVNSIVTQTGEYNLNGLEITPVSEVTDEDIKDYLNSYLEKFTQSIENPNGSVVKKGDTIVIDYVAYVDGEQYDDFSGTDEEFVVGSNTYPQEFEEKMVGRHSGETFDINVTLTDDFEDLAGKVATFDVTITKSLNVTEYTYDTITDEIIQELTDYESVEDFYEYGRAYCEDFYKTEDENNKKQIVMNSLQKSFDLKIPDDVLQQEIDIYVEQFAKMYAVSADGVDLVTYVNEQYDMTMTEFQAQVKEIVSEIFSNVLVCQFIAEKEGITVSDEEYEKYLTELASGSSYTVGELQKLYENYDTVFMSGEDYLRRMALCDKIVNGIVEKSTFEELEDTEETENVEGSESTEEEVGEVNE